MTSESDICYILVQNCLEELYYLLNFANFWQRLIMVHVEGDILLGPYVILKNYIL